MSRPAFLHDDERRHRYAARHLTRQNREARLRPRAAGVRVGVHGDIAAVADWPHAGATGRPSCHVFQTVEFLRTWQDTYGLATRATSFFISVHELDGTPLLMLPLAITRRKGVRELTFIDAAACDYNAPVLFPTERLWTRDMAEALWADVTAALPPFDVVSLVKLPATVDGLVNPLHLLAGSDNPESCHGTDLTGPWEAIEGTLQNLKTIRKQTRNLERIGPLRLALAQTAEERQALLATMLEQKQRRFEDTKVPGFAEYPERRTFLEQGNAVFAANGSLRFYGLYVGEEILAAAWGMVHAGNYYGLVMSSAAGEWARLSPGRVLQRLLMQALHAEGCRYLDKGIGDEKWKLDKRHRTVPLRRHIEAATWRGHVFLAGERAIAGLRNTSVVRRLRPYKWIVLRGFRDRARRLSIGTKMDGGVS